MQKTATPVHKKLAIQAIAALITLFGLTSSAWAVSIRLDYQGNPFDTFVTFPGGPQADMNLQAISATFILPFLSLGAPPGRQIVERFLITDGVNTYTNWTPDVELNFWYAPGPNQWSFGVSPIGLSVGDLSMSSTNEVLGGGRFRLQGDQSGICVRLLPNGFCAPSAARIRNDPGTWTISAGPTRLAEPGSFPLACIGLIGLFFLRRPRKRGSNRNLPVQKSWFDPYFP